MSSKQVTATEAKRVSQTGQVLTLMASGHTQIGACRKIGIDVQAFRYWLRKSDDSLTVLRKLGDEIAREEMASILLTQLNITERLIEVATATNTEDSKAPDPKLQLDIKKYLDGRLEKLGGDLRAQGRAEDAAADYLAGPKLTESESRFHPNTVNISPKPDGSFDVTTLNESEIVDAEFTEDDPGYEPPKEDE